MSTKDIIEACKSTIELFNKYDFWKLSLEKYVSKPSYNWLAISYELKELNRTGTDITIMLEDKVISPIKENLLTSELAELVKSAHLKSQLELLARITDRVMEIHIEIGAIKPVQLRFDDNVEYFEEKGFRRGTKVGFFNPWYKEYS